MKTLLQSLRLLLVLTILTGALYPLAVWAIGHVAFRDAAEGSLITRASDNRVVGSALLAQKFTSDSYFWSRLSAGDFATVASGASNAAWTNTKLRDRISAANAAVPSSTNPPVTPISAPSDSVTTSGSGLDPHLSPESVIAQLNRVATVRQLNASDRVRLNDLIATHTEGGQFTPKRVNILLLNLALDAAFPGSPAS